MKILLAIVHHWNPQGGGSHQSLRPNPKPRIDAFKSQLLALRRLGMHQSVLHMEDRAVYRTNDYFRNTIDILVVTDGSNHVLDYLDNLTKVCFDEIVFKPHHPKYLGFEFRRS